MKLIANGIPIGFFVWGGVLATIDNWKGAAALALIGLFAMLVFNIDKIQRFKGGGLETVFRNKIGEADDLIAKLKGSVVPVYTMTYSLLARAGRIGTSYSAKERDEIDDELTMQLLSIGLKEKDIGEKVRPEYNKFIASDYKHRAIKIVNHHINRMVQSLSHNLHMEEGAKGKLPEARQRELMKKAYDLKNQMGSKPPDGDPSDIHQFDSWLTLLRATHALLADSRVLDDYPSKEAGDAIEDFAYFLKNKKHKNKSAWLENEDHKEPRVAPGSWSTLA